MKILIFIFLLLFNTHSFGSEKEFKVLLRKKNSYATYLTFKILPDLVSNESFDGKNFKIVLGKTNTPIPFFHENGDLILKAATVYYHLNDARNFWIQKMGSEMAQSLQKITVRLEIKNQFDELGHFAHDNRNPQYNNALSIPEGETPEWVPQSRRDKWFKEIWYRPLKVIPTKELGSLGPNPLTISLMALQNPLISFLKNEVNNRIAREFFYRNFLKRPLLEDLFRYAGTYALFKLIHYSSKRGDQLFKEKYYYLDTAMVPEISYHEYAHIILSEKLQMTHSTPVNEGLADYFAAAQTNLSKIYASVPKRSNSATKNTKEKKKYIHWDELNRNASSDFTLSVLWDVRESLGEKMGNSVIYESRKYLSTDSSNISHELLNAILRACEVKCEQPKRDKLKLFETFSWKGF